ncbi:MAG: hypothetical protein LBI96_02870 [Odoribacteraceae bacterium]|jgi:hypothetical protein|nr:hypothetical protein [Odoribacteraceae bacterium]
MTTTHKRVLATTLLATLLAATMAVAAPRGKDDHGRAVAGKYDGTTSIELMQMTLPLRLELQRVHEDSVVVKIPRLALPNGQVFSFTSGSCSVRPVTRAGKQRYQLNISFSYTYNNIPLRVQATGTIDGDDIDAEVKAVIMDSMETRVTFKGKRAT